MQTKPAAAKRSAAVAAPAVPIEDFQLEQHVFFWLTEVIGRRNRLMAPALKPFGLRVPEWRVLAALHSRQRMSFKELAELASFDQTTLSRTIDRFVRDGLAERHADETDLRVTRVALTAKGEALFRNLWPSVHELNQRACARLPEGGVGMLRFLLGEMRKGLDEALERSNGTRARRRNGGLDGN